MNLIQSLEREGGHILVLAFLLVICIALSYVMPENALIVKVGDLTLGALLLAMKGNGNKSPEPSDAKIALGRLDVTELKPAISAAKTEN